jgi:hypothetical protein
MPIADTDHLSTPADMVGLLKRLTAIIRDVEAMPDNAQQRFWDGTNQGLRDVPIEELKIDVGSISTRTVSVLYAILVNTFGPKLGEMVRGDNSEQIEKMIAQIKESSARPRSEWDTFLDEQFAAVKGTESEGTIDAQVSIAQVGPIGRGPVSRICGASELLMLSLWDAENSIKERYFSSRDIVMMDIVRPYVQPSKDRSTTP